MLGKDTLSLFVDDGLQVGRYRWIKVDKVEGMKRYGDIQAALEEDKAACLEGAWDQVSRTMHHLQDPGFGPLHGRHLHMRS